MIEREEFFEKYRIDNEKFEESGLNWKDLVLIYEDYDEYKT